MESFLEALPSEGVAYKIEPGQTYLILVQAGSVSNIGQFTKELNHLNIRGVIHMTNDPPADTVKIYKLKPGEPNEQS